MGRATYGAARNKKKRRVRKLAKGFRGARGKRWRLLKEAVVKAATNALRSRPIKKNPRQKMFTNNLAFNY